MGRPAKQLYEFGPFRLDATERVLFREGEVVPLKPKVFDTLLVLVQSSGQVIEKDALMKTLWPDTVVEENNLNQNISALRRALGDGEKAGQYIGTVPRRGYRFVASVRESRDESTDLVLEKHTISRVLIQDQQQDTVEESQVLVREASTKRFRWTIAAASAIAVLGVAAYFLIATRSNRPAGIRSMAVLPFKSLSADTTDEYLGLGMSDALTTRLGGVTEVMIRPTSAVRKYGGADQDPVAAGRELTVESQQAIEKDPNYALAYAGISDSYILHGSLFVSAPANDVYPKAKDAAIKALSIDDNLAEAHTSLAMIRTQYDWQWAEAENEFKQAIALRPNYPTAHHWYALYLVAMRRFDEAVAEINRAQELDPLSLIVATDVGAILFVARRYDQAIEQCKKALELDPNFAQAHTILALIYEHQQRYDQWLVEREKVLTLAGKTGEAAAFRRTYQQAGPKGIAENWLAELKQAAGSRYVPAFAMAVAYTNLGDKDRAFEWLEKACDERSPRMPDIRVMPAYEKLRSDPRFTALVRRVGLEP